MTRKTRSFRPSPAMIISCLALFLALTGSAFAVGVAKNSVRSAQIVNGTIRTVDLRNNAVKAAKIAPDAVDAEEIATDAVGPEEIAASSVGSSEVTDDSLTNLDLGAASVTSSEVADDSLTANDLAPNSAGASELQANSVHSSELGTVVIRNNSQAIAAGATGGVAVNCFGGEQLLSGGGQSGHFGVEVTSTRPSGNGWLFQAKNNTGTNSTITAYAACLEN